MQYKVSQGEGFKFSDSGSGTFTGYCATFDVLDAQNDRIRRGAFKNLSEFKQRGFISFNHETMPVASVVDAQEDLHGLLVTGQFHSDARSQNVRTVVRERLERKLHVPMSIGYQTLEARKSREDGSNELLKLRLQEAAILTVFPANVEAGVSQVKSTGGTMSEWETLKLRARNWKESSASWSEQILSSAKWKEAKQWGKNVTIELKAAGDPISSSALNIVSAPTAVTPHGVKPYGVLQLLQRVNVATPQVMITQGTYPIVNASAFVAEGAAKPWVEPRWTTATVKLEEVACWTSVSRNALDDVVGLQRTIDVDLASLLGERTADRVINGTGATPDPLGILATPGVISVAYVATTNILDMLISGISQVQSAGYGTVNGIVMNPADIASLTITKTASGVQYIRPAELPTIVSDAHLAVGTAIVGDWSFAALYTRNGLRVEAGYKDNDILMNKLSIAAFDRVGLAITRPQAFAKVALA